VGQLHADSHQRAGVCVFAGAGISNDKFTYAYSTVPGEIISGRDIVTPDRIMVAPLTGQRVAMPGLQPTPIPVFLTLITSMFMHGGLAHIFGNMLFLWIFGDNIEDRVGHIRYLIFYLVCGVLAGLAHVFTTAIFAGDSASTLLVPSLGASGAISGVLGAYILLFPTKRVTVAAVLVHNSGAGLCCDRTVVWVPVNQRTGRAGEWIATGRSRVCGARRWVYRGARSDQGVSKLAGRVRANTCPRGY